MASAPPNTAANRTAEAAALALLLAAPRARYSLPSLIAANRIRPRAFRQIRPTNALASDMAAPHFAIVNAWAAEVPGILDAVPFGQAAVAAAIERAASRVGITVQQAKARFAGAVARVEQFHRTQWLSRVKASTGLDVSMFTSSSDVSDVSQATTSWNQALADDQHAQIRSRFTAAFLAGGLAVADAKARAADVIAKARTRAAGIGVSQVKLASRGMDRDRRTAAGVTSYVWHHSPSVHHPRPHHAARDGRTFKDGEISGDDEAGVPYGCQCWTSPAL